MSYIFIQLILEIYSISSFGANKGASTLVREIVLFNFQLRSALFSFNKIIRLPTCFQHRHLKRDVKTFENKGAVRLLHFYNFIWRDRDNALFYVALRRIINFTVYAKDKKWFMPQSYGYDSLEHLIKSFSIPQFTSPLCYIHNNLFISYIFVVEIGFEHFFSIRLNGVKFL